MQRIKKAYAENGDLKIIPDTPPLNGSENWEQGRGAYFELDNDPNTGDPLALDIDREQDNYFKNVISKNIKHWQENSYPIYFEDIEYPKNVIVKYEDVLYASKVDNNTALPTDVTNWRIYDPSNLNNTTYTVETIEDLITVPVGFNTVIVKDIESGGIFVSKTEVDIDPNTGSLYTVNGGTVFAKVGGGFWVRQYSGTINVKWFGAKGDYNITTKIGADDTIPFKKAFALGLDVIIPSGYNFLISEYITVNSNTKITINGNIISKEVVPNPYSSTLKLHTSGFDLNKVDNVTIQGNGRLMSEGFLGYTEDNFELHKTTGNTPIITVRSCTNIDIKDINLYKVAMGISINRNAEPYYTDWDLTAYDERPTNCNVHNVTIKCASSLGITLNSARDSSMYNNYCHTAGDSGLHIQFSYKCNVYNNKRFSRYGDGSDLGTGVDLLSKNDSQGLSIENSHSCNVYGNIVDGFIETGIDVKNDCTDINVFGNYVRNCQCMSITARGGDTVYGLNSSISIKDNYIERHGYLHTSGEPYINYSKSGAIYIDDTYSSVVENNTITGINDRGGEPIRCKGVNYTDLGFWGSGTIEDRVSYTSIIINNNTVNFQAYRSNYENATGFESKDCDTSGIKITGIWGKIKVNDNSILGDGFAGERYSAYLPLAGIEVQLTQVESVAEVITRSCDISNNTISYWNGGGVYIDLNNPNYFTAASVNIQNNTINNLPGYGMYLTNMSYSNISNNTIKNVGKVGTSVGYDKAITLKNVNGALLDGNSVTNTEGITAMYGYVNCVYVDATSVHLGSNFFQYGTGDTTSYYTIVNGGGRQSSLDTTAFTTTNATGKAIRFADGTMITTQTVTSNAPNVATGSMYKSNPLDINFPINFTHIPVVTCTGTYMSSFQSGTSSSGSLIVYNPNSLGYGMPTDITAIGRWK